MKKGPDYVATNNKLTSQQLADIKSLLPYGFFQAIADKRKGITYRQIIEVFAQRSTNAKQNKTVWEAINKKLIAYDRPDLIEAVNARVSFCQNLLLV